MALITNINNGDTGLTARQKLNILMAFYNAIAVSDYGYTLLRLEAEFVKDLAPSGKFLRDDGTWQVLNFTTQQKLSVTSSATIVMAFGTFNKTFMNVSALSVPSTISKTGTPSDGDILHFQIKDNGVARALTWSADFESKGETLPSTTIAGKRTNGMLTWDSVTSKFGLIALITEA